MAKQEYINLGELARRTSLSKRTLRSWVRASECPLPCFKVKGRLLFRWTEVEKWMQNFRVKTVNVNEVVNGILDEFGKENR